MKMSRTSALFQRRSKIAGDFIIIMMIPKSIRESNKIGVANFERSMRM